MWGRYDLIIIPLLVVFACAWGAVLIRPRPRRRTRLLVIPAPPHPTALALAMNARAAEDSRPGETPGPQGQPSGAFPSGPAQHPADGLQSDSPGLTAMAAYAEIAIATAEALRPDPDGPSYGFEGRAALPPASGWLAGLDHVLEGTATTGPPRCTYPYPESCDDAACPEHGWPDDAACPEHGWPDDAPFTLVRRVSYLDHKPAADKPWNTVYPCEWCAKHTPNGPQCGVCNLMTCAYCLRCPHQDSHDDQAYTRRATEGEVAAYRTAADTWAADMETSITSWHLDHSLTRMPWESTSFPTING